MEQAGNAERVAVYGTGKYAKEFIENHHKDISISAIFDGKRETGIFLGYPIFPLNKALDLQISKIIVASGVRAKWIIYDRIAQFCKENEIALCDQEGCNLFTFFSGLWDWKKDGYADADLLKKEINRHDVISFDIFDTLLVREVLFPVDVFDIVAVQAEKNGILIPGFQFARITAEENILKRKGEDTLDGIYRELRDMLGLSDQDVDSLKQLEIETEFKILHPRQAVVDIFHYAKSKGKKICLTTDMYLPKSFLRPLLEKFSISGYDKLFISGFEGCGKTDGLFSHMKAELPAASYLHIGDNEYADGLSARMVGVDAFLLPSPIESFKRNHSEWFWAIDSRSEYHILGRFIMDRYQNPFLSETKRNDSVINIQEFSRLYLAPICTGFLLWLIQRLSQKKYDKVLFAARDGYIFQKLYEWYRATYGGVDLPPSEYFYASRKSLMRAAVRTKKEFDIVNEKWKNIGMLTFYEGEGKSEFNRKGLENYLASIHIKHGNSYAFVEFMSSGTAQYFLQKLTKIPMDGYYLKWYKGYINNLPQITSYLSIDFDRLPMLFNNEMLTFILENIFSSPESSTSGYGKNGNIVLDKEMRSKEQIVWMEEAQRSISAYFKTFVSLYHGECGDIRASMTAMIFEEYKNLTKKCLHSIFDGIQLYDDLADKVFLNYK